MRLFLFEHHNTVRPMRDTMNPSMYPIYDTSDHFLVVGEFFVLKKK